MRDRITFRISEEVNNFIDERRKELNFGTDKKYFIYLLEKDGYKVKSTDL